MNEENEVISGENAVTTTANENETHENENEVATPSTEPKMFSQEEVNKLISDRLVKQSTFLFTR